MSCVTTHYRVFNYRESTARIFAVINRGRPGRRARNDATLQTCVSAPLIVVIRRSAIILPFYGGFLPEIYKCHRTPHVHCFETMRTFADRCAVRRARCTDFLIDLRKNPDRPIPFERRNLYSCCVPTLSEFRHNNYFNFVPIL